MSGDPFSLIEQEEREESSCQISTEFKVKGKMEEKTEWRGQSDKQIGGEEIRSGRLVGVAETSKELAEWRRLQRKNLIIMSVTSS